MPIVNEDAGLALNSVEIKQENVLDVLSKLQPDKSPGLDGMFQTFMRVGRIPEEWRKLLT